MANPARRHTLPVHGLHKFNRCRGQSILLLMIALPVFAGVAALATDVFSFYFNWYALQTGVDAAVLSGANYLPDYPSQAISTAKNYASSNGIQSAEISSTTAGTGNTTLSMTASRTVPYYFAKVLGLTSGKVSASATAQITSIGAAQGAVPLGIDYRTSYTYGQTVTLHQGQIGPGNWGALNLGGTGTSNYVSNIENGYSGTIKVGDILVTDPGNNPSNTQAAVNYRISQGQSQDPGGTFASHDLSDPRVMLVPMVDFSDVQGSSQVPVDGFAEVWIVDVSEQGVITTYFIEQTASGSQPNTAVQGFGAYASVLIQ